MKKSLSILIITVLTVVCTLCLAQVLIELRKNTQTVNEQYKKLTEDVADKLEEDKEYSEIMNNAAAGNELSINDSSDKLTVDVKTGYYLIFKDNKLLITEADKTTIIETKSFGENFLSELEKQERRELREGIYAEDIVTIYNILESLSS